MDVVFGKHWLSLCSDSKGEDDVNLFKPNVTSESLTFLGCFGFPKVDIVSFIFLF